MERAISCEFNLDTACVELKFADGSMISIDTVAVENEVADNMYQRSELDWLIYKPATRICKCSVERRLGEIYSRNTPASFDRLTA